MKLSKVRLYIESRLIGQKSLIDNMLVCLIAGGHMLLEGMPGLAKTRSSKALADSINAEFKRIQFTPDLLPSDITGSEVYLRDKNDFEFKPGPLFNNIILADEINRAPAKVQSALLEAMEERQITVGLNTLKLPELFMVLATQNPIDQEGTYNLPEAQLDRFMMKVKVSHPTFDEELQILKFQANQQMDKHAEVAELEKTSIEEVLSARASSAKTYIDEKIEKYIVSIVCATRTPENYSSELSSLIRHGASPRASISLAKAAKALAFLDDSDFVAPHHVQQVAYEILRHRIIPSFEAEADNISTDDIINQILQQVAVA